MSQGLKTPFRKTTYVTAYPGLTPSNLHRAAYKKPRHKAGFLFLYKLLQQLLPRHIIPHWTGSEINAEAQ